MRKKSYYLLTLSFAMMIACTGCNGSPHESNNTTEAIVEQSSDKYKG